MLLSWTLPLRSVPFFFFYYKKEWTETINMAIPVPSTYHQPSSSPTCYTRAMPKSLFLNKKMIKNVFLKNIRKMGKKAQKRQDRDSNASRQKNKTGNSKVESNDSPEIPDSGDIPSLPSKEGNRKA